MFNTSRKFCARTLGLSAALAVPMLVSNVALADEICGDTTCQKGFVCQSYEIAKCGTSERKDPTSAPVAGGAGSATGASVGAAVSVDGGTDPACDSYTEYQCVPAPCSADADCADGMVCHTFTDQTCSTSSVAACKPGTPECDEVIEPVEPPVCTTTTRQQCVARYELPCTTASDCGPGFTCEEQQSCWCSGSKPRSGTGEGGAAGTAVPTPTTSVSQGPGAGSGAATSSDGSEVVNEDPGDGSVDPPECGCAPTGTFECRLQTIACNADADCPSGLLCVDNPSGYCWASSDGTSGCSTPDPAKVCQPRYYGSSGGVAVGEDGSANAGSGGQASIPPTGTEPASADDPGDDDVGSNGDSGHGLPNTTGNHPHHLQGFGCAVASVPSLTHSGISSLLLSVGLALGIRRRRSRK